MNFLILFIAVLFFSGIWWISKKYDIELKRHHVNKTHKLGEWLIIIASLVFLGILAFVNNTPAFKSHYFIVCSVALLAFSGFMEWKFNKASKRHYISAYIGILLLVTFLFIDLILLNPLPVRLEADQVKGIYIEDNLVDQDLYEPILSAISGGDYNVRGWPATPRQEVTIKTKEGREVLIWEVSPYKSNPFFNVSTERRLFPQEMLMSSPELKLLFDDLRKQ